MGDGDVMSGKRAKLEVVLEQARTVLGGEDRGGALPRARLLGTHR